MGELSARMSSAEFSDWQIYYQLEPFGSHVDDLRFGTLASASTAPWGGQTSADGWFAWSERKEAAWGTWRDLKAAMGGVAAEPKAEVKG